MGEIGVGAGIDLKVMFYLSNDPKALLFPRRGGFPYLTPYKHVSTNRGAIRGKLQSRLMDP